VCVPNDDPEVVDGPQVEDLGDSLHGQVEHYPTPVQVPGGVQLLLHNTQV
jgi:hypothetical protein